MGVFAELSIVVSVSENEALVEPADELVKEKLSHVSRYVFTGESAFLDLSSDLNVIMAPNSVVNNEQPHPHILQRVNILTTRVKCIKFAHEIVK